MNKAEQTRARFELKILAPGEAWFDQIGTRFFRNATKQPVNIGFGHTMRAVETITILESETEAPPKGAPRILEGEIIEEGEYDV